MGIKTENSELLQCCYCGFKYDDPQFFTRNRFLFVAPAKTYCRSCVKIAVDYTLLKYLLWRLGWLALAFYIYLQPDAQKLAWLIINLIILGFLGFIVCFVHELGHAIASIALGIRVSSIHVGVGTKLFEISLFKQNIIINKNPFRGGLTCLNVAYGQEKIWKMCLIYLGGPLANILLFMVIAIFLGEKELMYPFKYGFDGINLLPLLAVDNLIVFLSNMFPHSVRRDKEKYNSDGKSLLLCLFRKKEILKSLKIYSLWTSALEEFNHKSFESALRLYKKGMEDFPDILSFKYMYASTLYNDRKFQDAQVYLDNLIQSELEINPDKLTLSYIYNLSAWIIFYLETRSRYDEALILINKALELNSDEAGFLDTRGCLDIEMGNIGSGMEYINKSINKTTLIVYKATGLYAIAMAKIKTGNFERAEFIYHLICKLKQESELVLRLEKLIKTKGS